MYMFIFDMFAPNRIYCPTKFNRLMALRGFKLTWTSVRSALRAADRIHRFEMKFYEIRIQQIWSRVG